MTQPFLPYGRQSISEDDIAAVVAVLRSDVIAQGPQVEAFEVAFANAAGARHAVACASGTAALMIALKAMDVGKGDLCIVPAITFLSTATAALWLGAEVLVADVDPLTGLLTPQTLGEALARAKQPVKAVLPVHLGGRLCDSTGLAAQAQAHGALVVEDAPHAVGGTFADGARVGACQHSHAATFSFHPVKTLACGEGGMVTTADPEVAALMRRLRNHGVTHDPALMVDPALSLDGHGMRNPWSYEQLELGLNARMTDMAAALGLSQLGRLGAFVARRAHLAALYDAAFAPLGPLVQPVSAAAGDKPGLHLHSVRIDFAAAGVTRAKLMRRLAAQGIGTQVHYIPLHRQPYMVTRHGARSLPGAEAWYAQTLSLPLFPAMADGDVTRVAEAVTTALRG